MRLLISKTIEKLEGYKVVNKLEGVDWVSVETLVYHSSIDEYNRITFYINDIPDFVKTLIYMNNDIDPMLCAMFKGKGGYVYNDESFLADKETLNYIVENVGMTEIEVQSPMVKLEALSKIISKVANSEPDQASKYLCSPAWLSALNSSIESMSTALTLSDTEGTRLVNFVDDTSRLVGQLEKANKKISADIVGLQNTIKGLNAKTLGAHMLQGNANTPPTKFGTYSVPAGIRKVIYVRCFGDVPYLVTFFLQLQDWAKNPRITNVKSRILIARQQLSTYMLKYSEIAKITKDSITDRTCTDKVISYITYEPNKTVLDTFFNDINMPVYFVLDFMQSDVPLVTGHMVDTLNAYCSVGMYNRIDKKSRAPLSRTIFSQDGVSGAAESGSIIIPRIEGYHDKTPNEQKSAYFSCCKGSYTKIINLIKNN